MSNIIYVSKNSVEKMPESRIRGVTFTTYNIINQGV